MQTSKAKKAKGVHCCAYACFNKPVKRKAGLCHKHFARLRKEKDPIYDRYYNFKNNALKRKKEFTITLQEFRDFCLRTGYIITKGMRGRNATIDRIKNEFGYHIWNIQLLTNMQNIRKYWDFDRKNDEFNDYEPPF